MGVGLATAEFLVAAAAGGVNFERTGTIGRQALFVGPRRIKRILERYERSPAGMTDAGLRAAFADKQGLLDPLLQALGAREVLTLDASPYEGADIVHDLNEPVPEELHGRFSLLFDGGSLEHVFDVPAALRNYMQMVEVGGHLIIHTVANNYFGHGFYQFSSELFYRVLSPESGYEIERIVLIENDLLWTRHLGLSVPIEVRGPWYEVADSAAVEERVLLQTRRPVIIQVQARRVVDAPILSTPVHQSDYVARWSAGEPPPARSRLERVGRLVPVDRRLDARWDFLQPVFSVVRPLRERHERAVRSLANRHWYRRVFLTPRDRRAGGGRRR